MIPTGSHAGVAELWAYVHKLEPLTPLCVAGLPLNLFCSAEGTQLQSRLSNDDEWQLPLARAFASVCVNAFLKSRLVLVGEQNFRL